MGLNERQQELVSALLDEALEGAELEEARQLVASEPEAARLLEQYRSDLVRLQSLPRVPADPALRSRIRPPAPRLAPRWLKAAVIVLLVGGVALWVFLKRPIRPLLSLLPAFQGRIDPGEHRLVKVFPGLKGRLVAEAVTHFRLMVDGQDGHQSEAHFVLRYDFDGDGKFDRTETYHFLCDDAPGWQEVTDRAAELVKVEGSKMQDFTDGVVEAELQCTHPENALLANVEQIVLPNSAP